MILQVVVEEDLMDEARVTFQVVLRLGLRERQVPLEVLVLGGNRVEVFDVERLAQASCAVPERYLAVRGQASELIEDVRAHGRHARAAADEDHLVVGWLREELAEGTRDDDFVARLEIEDVGGHLPGGILPAHAAAARRSGRSA